jgi:hypothetical protein
MCQLALPIGDQAQHREIAVPVVQLAEAPAGHHVRPRQREQAVAVDGIAVLAHQQRPQRADVLADAQPRAGRDVV